MMLDRKKSSIVLSWWFLLLLFLLFVGTNPYLTFHCVSQGTILLDLAPDDKEYQSVEEEVLKISFLVAFFSSPNP